MLPEIRFIIWALKEIAVELVIIFYTEFKKIIK